MIEPEDCRTMTDVRAGVDALDERIVALLAVRTRFMDAAARIKQRRDEVRDEPRKAAVIAHAREMYAEECGFPDALLIASADNPEAVAAFSDFLAEQLAAMGAIEGRAGQGAALTFSILGLMLSRSLDFHRLDGAALNCLFDALETQARALPADQ